jgi:branched-chain amino acid transport system substrate-binding protein
MKMASGDAKVVAIAIILLIAGIGGGFALGYSIYQSPRDEQISFLQSQNAELQSQNAQLKSQVSDLQGDVSALMGRLQEAEASIAQLQSQLEEADALRAQLQSQISALQAYISLLEERSGLSGEITIGSLLPLTGGLATLGQDSKVAIDLAVEEVNEFLTEIGAAWTLKVIHENTGTSPSLCLTKLQSLAAKGIKFIVGPMSDQEVQNIKGFADANEILVVSQSSTATALAIPDDYIFRFCPTDIFQGRVIAKLMYDDGVRHVFAAWRGDAWGDALVEAARVRFEELGGTFVETVRYAPEAAEFSAEAKALADKVTGAIATYGADKVGVLFLGSGEVATFLTAAREHDVLWAVKWYGSSGTALNEAMISDEAVAEFANKTRFINPIFSPKKSERYDRVVDRVEAVLGRVPDAYAFVAYDVVWALAHSLLSVNKYDSEDVRAVLPDVTESISGASGSIVLDEAGDRESADYDLWIVIEEAGAYSWKHVGIYIAADDSVTWL